MLNPKNAQKPLRVVGGLLAAALCFGGIPARAEETYVSIADLHAEASSGWHETVEAHGRTIEIDLDDVYVPDVDKMPVLKIRQADFSKEVPEGFELIDDSYGVLTMERGISYEESIPVGANTKSQDRYMDDAIDWAIQAENHPMTAGDVRDLLLEGVSAAFGADAPEKLSGRELTVSSRIYYVDNKTAKLTDDPFTEAGTYVLYMRQLMQGIPVLTSVALPELRNTRQFPAMELMISLKDQDNYSLRMSMVEETETVAEDIPLRPFADVQQMLRGLIESGNLRTVESLKLGYAMYVDPEEDGVAWLMPTWICEGEYYETPEAENPFLQEPWLSDPSMQDARIVSSLTADAQALKPTDPLAESMQTGGYMGESPEKDKLILWEEVSK